jgi:hypothetical protein
MDNLQDHLDQLDMDIPDDFESQAAQFDLDKQDTSQQRRVTMDEKNEFRGT